MGRVVGLNLILVAVGIVPSGNNSSSVTIVKRIQQINMKFLFVLKPVSGVPGARCIA